MNESEQFKQALRLWLLNGAIWIGMITSPAGGEAIRETYLLCSIVFLSMFWRIVWPHRPAWPWRK